MTEAAGKAAAKAAKADRKQAAKEKNRQPKWANLHRAKKGKK